MNIEFVKRMINAKINKRFQMVFICFFLSICVLLVYGQVISYDFINIDDSLYVTQNPHIQNGFTLNNFSWAFTTTNDANWNPLTWLSFMADYEIYGLRSGGYHFTNLLFHIINTLLLLFVLNKLTGASCRSVFVAALFALHPLHVESVAWVSARKDVLSTFFWLLTIWAYSRYVTRPKAKRYFLVFTFFALGLMAKPMVVTLPFVLLLLDYWPLNRFDNNRTTNNHKEFQPCGDFIAHTKAPAIRKVGGTAIYDKISLPNAIIDLWQNMKQKTITFLVLEKIPLFILTIFSCIITYIAQKHAGAVASADAFPLDVRMINAIVSYGGYIGRTLWPNDLSAFYSHPGIWPFGKVLLSWFFLLISSLLVLFSSRRYPYMAVGWLWFLGTLVPVIGLVQVGDQAMADRYTYMPLIGLFIMIVWCVPDIVKPLPYRKIILNCGSILIIITLSILSWQRCQLWGDKVALWSDALKNNKVAFTYNIRGLGYADQGQYQRAIEDFNAAMAIKPDHAEAIINRANVYVAIGQYGQALRDFNHALKLKPHFADNYYNRGILYLKMNRFDLAIDDFTMAIRIEPNMADAYNNRGVAFLVKRQYEKAFADFNQTLRINQNNAQAYYNRGILYNIHKQYDLAIEEFIKALKIKPDYAAAYFNMGLAFSAQGKFAEAINSYENTLRIQPNNIDALKNQGIILKKMKRLAEANNQFKRILQIKPNDREALHNIKAIERLQKKISRISSLEFV
jgi:tetratricopeptide (TPR) repeat protein